MSTVGRSKFEPTYILNYIRKFRVPLLVQRDRPEIGGDVGGMVTYSGAETIENRFLSL